MNGEAQSRRPDLSYGLNVFKEFDSKKFGKFDLNLNYKYTGEYIDWDGSQNSKKKAQI